MNIGDCGAEPLFVGNEPMSDSPDLPGTVVSAMMTEPEFRTKQMTCTGWAGPRRHRQTAIRFIPAMNSATEPKRISSFRPSVA